MRLPFICLVMEISLTKTMKRKRSYIKIEQQLFALGGLKELLMRGQEQFAEYCIE